MFGPAFANVEKLETGAFRADKIQVDTATELNGLKISPGHSVSIVGGPLEGMRAVYVQEVKDSRCIVSIEVNGRKLAIELDQAWIWAGDA
jgi:hypothetical protein